ncbi:MAG TPA: ferritin-like domain-containing protein [Gemmatimonadaceae bacterium]|nr:ferritin-like domain-containing protein [Gemmatimonadaceae bacterium]
MDNTSIKPDEDNESNASDTIVVSRAEQLWDVVTRRDFMRIAGVGGAVVLLPSLFTACDDKDKNLTGPNRQADKTVTLDLRTDIGIFNFLFLFEQTEVAYYNAAVASSAFSGMTAEQKEVIADLRAVETVHREFLRALLGSNGVGNAAFDTAKINAAAASGALILRTAEMLEDTGVATQIGFGKYIQSADFLGIAGKINSVEARHVAAIRDMREAAGLAAVGAAGTRFAGDDIVVPSGPYAGLNAKIEYPDALARVAATGFLTTVVQVGSPPAPKPGTPDFGPPNPTP